LKDFGGLKNFCDKKCDIAGYDGMTYYGFFLKSLKDFVNFSSNDVIDGANTWYYKIRSALHYQLPNIMKTLIAPENLEETLKGKLNTKKKNMEKESFFRIPGKQIAEALNCFDD